MEKEKTGFWKTHPLLKAITVLAGFFLVFYSLHYLYWINVPIIAPIAYLFYFLYYIVGGLYVLGCLYGIWLDRRCHLKFSSFCLVLLILIVMVSIFHFFCLFIPVGNLMDILYGGLCVLLFFMHVHKY